MKTVTSITTWNDSVGKRISITYSDIDPDTGKIISDNNRIDRIVTNVEIKQKIDDILDFAQGFVES